MDYKAPGLNELLKPFLIDECDLTSTHNINFWSYWLMSNKYGEIIWICDVHEDRVVVSRGPTIKVMDPDFMSKLHNAIRYVICYQL
jgi:hypothetical protein